MCTPRLEKKKLSYSVTLGDLSMLSYNLVAKSFQEDKNLHLLRISVQKGMFALVVSPTIARKAEVLSITPPAEGTDLFDFIVPLEHTSAVYTEWKEWVSEVLKAPWKKKPITVYISEVKV